MTAVVSVLYLDLSDDSDEHEYESPPTVSVRLGVRSAVKVETCSEVLSGMTVASPSLAFESVVGKSTLHTEHRLTGIRVTIVFLSQIFLVVD